MNAWSGWMVDQLTWHWEHQLRPGLATLTTDEYLWEPGPDAWSIRPRSEATTPMAAGAGDLVIDWAWPEPDPPPLTTIAWRMAHLTVGVLAARSASHFGGPEASYLTWRYAPTADTALGQLDQAYANWTNGLRRLPSDAFESLVGPSEGEWADASLAELVLHINREVIHHGAEILLLRDLYRRTG